MFIPRSLAKRAVKPVGNQSGSSLLSAQVFESKKRTTPDEQSSATSSDDSDTDHGDDSGSGSGPGFESDSNSNSDKNSNPVGSVDQPKTATPSSRKKHFDPSEIAARLELALSDLSLWRNESLYQRVAGTSDWFIPFSRLRDHPLLSSIFIEEVNVPDASLVNALRSHGWGNFEFQMRLREPSNAAWKDKGKAPSGWVGAAGGYEIRSKWWAKRESGWMDALASVDERIGWREWFMLNVFPVNPITEPSLINPQPGRFRGQAFVVFATYELAQTFCKRWVWNAPHGTGSDKQPEFKSGNQWNKEAAEVTAKSSGFRSLSKPQWDKLKAEYLEHQARILKQGPRRPKTDKRCNDSTSDTAVPIPAPARPPRQAPAPRQVESRPPPFPPGILVFVKRIHPETNKTTLKNLFTRGAPNGVEYIDFQKGIDSAHVRLRTPADAVLLTNYLSKHKFSKKTDWMTSDKNQVRIR
ncbi:hypothetical protein RHS01_01403 [Rhizoctonia solani]|uniref:XRRM domain-containing protein n=1 Tax=Rhizoctonia solani TaxID=456999 RepID=A0A8H7IJ09_9AGAM|nr:hypothetical protein RHS01_01403 [Rhizoctonia solani]